MEQNITLGTLERRLSTSILLIVSTIFLFTFVFHIYIQIQHTKHSEESAQLELNSALKIYTSNLLSRIGIILSSTEFITFLRSGSHSRDNIEKDFSSLMSRIPKHEIQGWKMINRSGDIIFESGSLSNNHIKFNLCYVGDTFNAKYGLCIGTLYAYINNRKIVDKLKDINSSIESCVHCTAIQSLPSVQQEIYGMNSIVDLHIKIEPKYHWNYFLSFAAVSLIALFILGYMIKQKVKRVFNKQVINPILGMSGTNTPSNYDDSTVKEIIELRYKKELLKTRTYAEEKQNRLIANELHDSFGAHVMMLKWDIEQLETSDNKKEIDVALRKTDTLVELINNFINFIRPEILDTLGLNKSLIILTEEWTERSTGCKISSNLQFNDRDVPEVVTHFVYRICQEALTNIHKHSFASLAKLEVYISENNHINFLIMKIKDNGVGIGDTSQFSSGHGLNSMKERAVSLGGTFDIKTEHEFNTVVHVKIPIRDDILNESH